VTGHPAEYSVITVRHAVATRPPRLRARSSARPGTMPAVEVGRVAAVLASLVTLTRTCPPSSCSWKTHLVDDLEIVNRNILKSFLSRGRRLQSANAHDLFCRTLVSSDHRTSSLQTHSNGCLHRDSRACQRSGCRGTTRWVLQTVHARLRAHAETQRRVLCIPSWLQSALAAFCPRCQSSPRPSRDVADGWRQSG